MPGLVRVTVKGKGGSYAISSADLPPSVEVILDPPNAMGGQCGGVRYAPPLACGFNASRTTLTCK